MTRDGGAAQSETSAPGILRTGFLQFSPQRGRVEANVERIERAVREASVDLLVAPELATTGYLFRDRDDLRALAEPVPEGPSCSRLARACREVGTALVLGIAERDGASLFNSAVLLTPDGGAVCYRKVHLFDTEIACFDRSPPGPVMGRVGEARVGLMICFDWRFPEWARRLALEGADVIAHPANLVHPHCQDAMVTRSLENGVFTVTASRTGSDSLGGTTLTFAGRSQIVSPRGERLALADGREECVRVASLRIADARAKSVTQRNDLLGDRRTDLYGPVVAADRAERGHGGGEA